MELKTLSIAELEARKAALAKQLEAAKSNEAVDPIEAEMKAINEELESRKALEARKAELRKAVAAGAGIVIDTPAPETRKDNKEIRNSQAYIDAFARYIMSGDDHECRALLTENVSGSLPVPEFVDQIIHTAWESDEILSRVNKTTIRGNLKVAFELTASPAVAHTEGTTAVTEQSLSMGIVTLLPKMVKKLVRVSDEVVAMGGEPLIRYIYDELTYQIIKKLASLVVGDIAGANTSNGSTYVGVPKVSAAPSVTAIPTAAANLSEEARDVVVILNRLTEAAFIEAMAAGNFAIDPFAGLRRIYTSALPAYSTASDNQVYAIVGDLRGAQVNYPEGEGVVIKWDDLTEADGDMVRVIGRQYAAHGLTAPGKFVNITKPAAATT